MTDPGAGCEELAGYIRGLQDGLAAAQSGSDEQRGMLEDLAAALLDNYEQGCGPASQAGSPDLDAAIGYADQLLSAEPDDSRSQARFMAAMARYYRFGESDNPADLDLAICHASALAAADDDPPADVLALLGEALALRYRLVPAGAPTELPDLSQAIRVLTLERQLLAADHPAQIPCTDDLATLHADRHELLADGSATDLSSAISCLRWLRSAVPPGAELAAEVTTRLGLGLAERALRHGNAAADVDEAVVTLAAAGRLLPAQDARRPFTALYLGVMLGARFSMHGGGPTDRAEAITTLRAVLARAALDAERSDLARIVLSQLLLLRFVPASAGTGSPLAADFDWAEAARTAQRLTTDDARKDADEVIAHLQRTEITDDSPDAYAAVSVMLGTALLARGADDLAAEDLDRILGCFERAARALAPSTPGQPEITAMHAWILSERASRPGREADIEPAVHALAQAEHLLRGDHPMRPVILRHQGKLLCRRGLRRSSAADLTAAIDALSRALQQMPGEHPLRISTLALLAGALLSMSQFDLSALPVDRVVRLFAEAVAHRGADPGTQAVHLQGYGMALHLQAIRDQSYDGFANAARQVRRAAELLAADDTSRGSLLVTLASMLSDQYTYVGNIESLDAAVYYLNEVDRALEAVGGPPYDPERTDLCSVRAVRGHAQLGRAMGRQDIALFDAAIADLQFALESWPAESPLRAQVASNLATARIGRGALSQDSAEIKAAWRQVVDVAEGLAPENPNRTGMLGRAGLVCVTQARLTADRRLLDKGIELLTEVADHPSFGYEPFRLVYGLGDALVHRYDLSRNPADLDGGIGRLEEAARGVTAEPGSPVAAITLGSLADAYRKRADPARGDQRSAISTGLAALRERAGDVLLQSSTQRALASARMSTADSAEIAGWALGEGLAAAAVEALELGRGLVLHAATALADLPARLRSAGCDGLAAEWEKSAGPSGAGTRAPDAPPWDGAHDDAPYAGPAVPSDLRHRVLLALEWTAAGDALLAPPTVAQIASSLRLAGRDMLAYLLLTEDGQAGRAVVIAPDGSCGVVPLPGLNSGAARRIDTYAAARQRALQHDADDVAAHGGQAGWNRALGDLCDWAWTAAVQPLLEQAASLAPGRIPQLVLIPCGQLGVVPWHAARTRDSSGRLHHAVEDAVFSYAASGRQLIDAAQRAALPASARAVFVADPVASDIPWATWEARQIRAAYYPQCSLLGSRPPDIATPGRVLEWMPGRESAGASMLHLSCHALAAASPAESHLRLAGKALLPVSSILARARGRQPDAPGGLVVLSACMSDLSTRDYDEALTLATAFLAAGAVSVVGSRWQVADVRTALLMFMFHQYLTSGQPPASALRSAQLWMLDPERVIPLLMPRLLADEVTRHDLGEATAWAAFSHQGQ